MSLRKKAPRDFRDRKAISSPKSKLTASTAVFERDKLFCYGIARSLRYLNLVEIADLSDYFPSVMFGGPLCDDPYGRYWQVTGNYVRRFVPNGLGTGELTEWSSIGMDGR
jgi:hypothetical protein